MWSMNIRHLNSMLPLFVWARVHRRRAPIQRRTDKRVRGATGRGGWTSCCKDAKLWKLVVFLWVLWPSAHTGRMSMLSRVGPAEVRNWWSWCVQGWYLRHYTVLCHHVRGFPPSDQQGCAGDILLCTQNKLEEAAKATGTKWTAIMIVLRRTVICWVSIFLQPERDLSDSLASVMLPDCYNNNLSHLLVKTSTFIRHNVECRGCPIGLLCSHCRPVAAAARANLLDQLWKFLSVLFTYTPTFIYIEPRLKNTRQVHQLLSGTMATSVVHVCALTAGWTNHALSTDGPAFVGLAPDGSACRH